MRPCVLIGLTACVLVMQGFQSTRPAAREEAPPMDLTGRNETIWGYLQQKYDGDNDGRITPDEYDRKGGQFDRLDRNSDGVLTDEDFASGRGGMHRGRMMRGMRAQGIVATYFQDDDDPQSLSLDELKRAVAAYDTDSDGTLRRSEFEARAEGRKVKLPGRMGRMMDMMMGDAEPWEVLTETVDANGDGDIAGEELVAFFKERDDGDGVWTFDRGAMRGRRGRAGAGGGGGGERPMSGVPEGQMAPDFTLMPPEGGKTVTLSSFRRNVPVALIFGSYT